jgi:outer membrane receptor protein involved in Fe transport
VSYNYRYQEQHDSTNYILQDFNHTTTLNYDRKRFLPESESDLEFTANYLHRFNKDGHELNVNMVTSTTHETEDNRYINTYQVPATALSKDNMLYKQLSYDTEFSAEYSLPINEKSKFEAGYIYQHIMNNLDLKRDTLLGSTNSWTTDLSRSNVFNRSENTHVLYATYEQEIGKFGFLARVRAEQTFTNSHLVTMDSTILNQYTRLYPTLHMSYQVSDVHELQLNYSHRIRRPEDEELNPFPEYQDLRNIRAGNPYLKPEDIHSFELGYQMKKDATTFLSTVYYRNSYNLITSVIHDLGNNVFKTTLENLSQSQAAGLELILSSSIGKWMNFNLATNTYYNIIDASALGFSANKSNFAWSANGNVSVNLSKSTVWQITSNYTAETLTPQGYRLPSFVMNSGFKQELFKKKAAIILTVSDIFNSMRNKMIIDTPELQRTEIRRRSSQTIYLGFTYSFGSTPKKTKDNSIKYDNQL